MQRETKQDILSVIVPVYNMQNYIEKCLKSIEKQTYMNLEIIVIDDGSTDKTGKIIDEISKFDNRIIVIHKENEKIIRARKDGVKISTGEYITFVDGDDWIEPNMYEMLLSHMFENELDLVTSGLIYEEDGCEVGYELDSIPENVYCREEIYTKVVTRMMFDFFYGKRGITSSVSNKIFRKCILKRVLDDVDERLTYGEDAAIVYPYIVLCSKIKIINSAWYHYCIRNGSMATTYDKLSLDRITIFYENMKIIFGKLGIVKKLQYQLEKYVHQFVCDLEWRCYGIRHHNVQYIFPFECIPANSNVVIYGAGNVGKNYYMTIKCGEYAKVVLWVDKKASEMKKLGFPVSPIEMIESVPFDYIVIAVDAENIACSIRTELHNNHAVPLDKIVWKQNKWLV